MGIGLNGLNSGAADIYSSLLGGSSTGGGSDMSSLLSDYASIKNGSYGKMMKSYYSKITEEDSTSSSTNKSKTKEKDYASSSAARKFYETASALSSMDFSEGNIDELYDSVSAFIKDYNTMIKNASNSSVDSVKAMGDYMNDLTYSNYKLLARVGITMNADRTLSINEDTFKSVNSKTGATNAPTLKTLFQGVGSYADKLIDKASQIYRAAGDGESVTSAKAKYAGSTGSISSSSKTDSKDDTSKVGTSKTAKDSASATAASALYKYVEKLSALDYDGGDKDKAYNAFLDFVNGYNDLLDNTKDSENSNVIKQADYLKSLVSSNKSALSRLGVTVNSDNTLSINEDKFKEADLSTMKSLFTGVYSFGEKMTDRINQIYRYATQGDTLTAQAYTSQGGYSVGGTGSMLDTTM